MNTRELIAKLQELDPSGELNVVVSNEPVYCVSKEPGFHDGDYGVLLQNPEVKGFNIQGYKITGKGEKIVLHLYGLENWLTDEPEGLVDLSDINPKHQDKYQKLIEKFKSEKDYILNLVDLGDPEK